MSADAATPAPRGPFGNISNKGPGPLINTNKISGGIDKMLDVGGKVIDKALYVRGKVIDQNSGAAAAKAFGKQWDASAPPARKLAVERGNTFYVIPASELANWEKATANLDEEWVKDVTAKGHDGKMLLQSARDLIKKYEGAK